MKYLLTRITNTYNWTIKKLLYVHLISLLQLSTNFFNTRYTVFSVSNFPEPYWDVYNSKQLFFFTRTMQK